MIEAVTCYLALSISLMGIWLICDLVSMGELDVLKLNRIRVFFYTLFIPGTLVWGCVLMCVVGIFLLAEWVSKTRLWIWLTVPLNK